MVNHRHIPAARPAHAGRWPPGVPGLAGWRAGGLAGWRRILVLAPRFQQQNLHKIGARRGPGPGGRRDGRADEPTSAEGREGFRARKGASGGYAAPPGVPAARFP